MELGVVPHPVAVAADVDDVAVMDEPNVLFGMVALYCLRAFARKR